MQGQGQGLRSLGGSGGNCPPLPKQCEGSTGATGCPFYRNCTSKFVRYSQELEFITILKQCQIKSNQIFINKYINSLYIQYYPLIAKLIEADSRMRLNKIYSVIIQSGAVYTDSTKHHFHKEALIPY